jgi:hypothetical protein
LAAIFSFEGSKKWIIREGFTGISIGGWGAPIASGCPNWRGFLMRSSGGEAYLEAWAGPALHGRAKGKGPRAVRLI